MVAKATNGAVSAEAFGFNGFFRGRSNGSLRGSAGVPVTKALL